MTPAIIIVSYTTLDEGERVLAACVHGERAHEFIAQHLKSHDPDNEFYLGEPEVVADQVAFIVPVVNHQDDGNEHSEWYTLTTVEMLD